MRATVTDRAGVVYNVALEFDGVDDEGVTFVGKLPITADDVENFWIDVVPPHTKVRLAGLEP